MTGLEFLNAFLPIIVYILLIAILIVGIVLGVRLIITLGKVEKVVDDVNEKVQSLNGFFSVIDFTADKIALLSDNVVNVISNGILKFTKIFKKKED